MIGKCFIALFVCVSILLPCGSDPQSGEPPDPAQSMEQATLRTPCLAHGQVVSRSRL